MESLAAFGPFRAVGQHCGTVPASFTTVYGAPVLMIPLGHTYHLLRGLELLPLREGPQFERKVRAVAQCGKYRFVAEGPRIHFFVHHKPVAVCLHASETRCRVTLILAVDDFLFSVGEDKQIVIWNSKLAEILGAMLVANSETPTAMVTPIGYDNKILLATAEGRLHLYNFRTKKVIYVTPDCATGGITCLACSASKDVVAFGTGTGIVKVYNFAQNTVIMEFAHLEGSVSAISFRCDRDGFLCSATSTGETAIWDLFKRTLDGVMSRTKQERGREDVIDGVHSAAVHTVVYFPAHPLLVTCAADNSICQFRLDTIDGMGRLVRERRGHNGSCTSAVFLNADLVLTCGEDRSVRCTHLFSDRASWELSQGKIGRKRRLQRLSDSLIRLPPVTTIATCTLRANQWASILTTHECSGTVCGWRADIRALAMKVTPVDSDLHIARCCTISHCGNFGIVGASSGHLCRINLQDESTTKMYSVHGPASHFPAHRGSIEGVAVVGSNEFVVSVALDCMIRVWHLLRLRLLRTVRVPSSPAKLVVHPASYLAIVGCSDYSIRMYDCRLSPAVSERRSLTGAELDSAITGDVEESADDDPVRVFKGHTAPITAMALSPDSLRHVVSASSDCALLLWDLLCDTCVGAYRFEHAARTLAFHCDGLFLLTTHQGTDGAFLWTNNLRYGFAPDVIEPPPDAASLPLLRLPLLKGESDHQAGLEDDEGDSHSDHEEEDEWVEDGRDQPELYDPSNDVALQRRRTEAEAQAALDRIPRGGFSVSSWSSNMLNAILLYDELKEKNRPLLPPRKEKAPFFLPTTRELQPTFIISVSAEKGTDEASHGLQHHTRAFQLPQRGDSSQFRRHLSRNEAREAMDLAVAMTAAEITMEIDRLGIATLDEITSGAVDPTSDSQLHAEMIADARALSEFFQFLSASLRHGHCVDFAGVLLARAIQEHASRIVCLCQLGAERVGGVDLTAALVEVAEANEQMRIKLKPLEYSSSIVATFANAYM